MSKTILLTGAAGLLGTALLRKLSPDFEIVATQRENPVRFQHGNVRTVSIDLTNAKAVSDLFADESVDIVMNCAGAVDVDRCQTDHVYALSGNKSIVDNLIAQSRKYGCHLFQISTDYVFPDIPGPNKEDDVPRPVNFYGESKLMAEEAIRSSGIFATVVRVCALYSLNPGDKVNLLSKMLDSLRQGKELSTAQDLWSTPTEVNDLSISISQLIAIESPPPVIHLAGSDFISRYEFALRIAEANQASTDLVRAVTVEGLGLSAPRPSKAGLISNIARELLDHLPRSYPELLS
jgi:dTDP-4-dehydrorhamnose reductase